MKSLLIAPILILLSAPLQADPVEFLGSGKVLPRSLPLSEAVRVGDTLYLSGQIGNVPGKLELVPGGIPAEARQVMENIRTLLETHGYTMGEVVKCTVMLADMSEWPAFNDIYRTFFDERYPGRSSRGSLRSLRRFAGEVFTALPGH